MKKILAFLLTFVLLAPMIPARAETVALKPYYGIGSSDFNRTKFPNLEGRPMVSVVVENGEVYLSASGAGRDINKIASTIKDTLDQYPEGMRTFVLHKSSDVFQLQEDTIYFEEGVEKLRAVFSEFIKVYAEIGGKLDGIVLDVEYVDTYNWYLYSKQYTKENKDVYKNIVENPRYKTDVRPLLAERGFKFYPDATKTEIWSAYPRLKGAEKEEYADCLTIWDTVMRIRLNNYMTYAVYEPLAQHMPGTCLYDYQSRATNAWLKDLSDKGEHKYVAGNSVPVGITSHHNTYGSRLSNDFFAVDGQPIYNNPVAYNGAEFAATPFNRILWDVNLMKNMYAASGGNVAITVAEYDYSPDKIGTPSNTPYYTESIFHIGLLDPKPFCIYMYDKAFETTAEYNKRAKVLQQIMAELTRVAGYADRKPIEVPATWNSAFLLSGIYANGRNLWRLTPDMDQIDPQRFALAGKDPAFTAKGQTITFPQGKLIKTATISVVGSYGYWIETPKNVTPIITNDADRYSKNPSFAEDLEKYNAGTAFNAATAKPQLTWQVSGDHPTVQTVTGGKALALTQNTIDVMKKVSAKGVHLVVDSGRRFPVVPKELRELPFMRYFVLCNGAEIYDKFEDKVMYSSEIPFERALHIYDSLTSHPEVYLDCYQSDGSWARAEDYARIDEFVEDQSHRDVLRNTRTPVEGLRQFLVDRNKPVQKFQTIYKNMAIRDKEMERITALYPDMTVTSAYTYNLEVNVPDATKGIGLIKLGEILGIPRKQIIAFGDGENDISMLRSAGIGYAMENAPDSVKALADKIAPPNTEDGVAQILTELFL